MALNIVLGVLLVISVIVNIYFGSLIKKVGKVLNHFKLVEDVKTSVLAHTFDFDETLVYVEAVRKAMLLVDSGKDAEAINYDKIVREAREQIKNGFSLADLLVKLSEHEEVVGEDD